MPFNEIMTIIKAVNMGLATVTPEQCSILVDECRNLGYAELEMVCAAVLDSSLDIYTELSAIKAEKNWS